MNSTISDVALDLGVFALDREREAGGILSTFLFAAFSAECVDPAWHEMDVQTQIDYRCLVAASRE